MNGKLPRARQALTADAFGSISGALLGTSTVTAYVESAAGVAEGGRTGLANMVTGVLMLASLFLYPLSRMAGDGLKLANGFQIYPVVAPALIVVGSMMLRNVRRIRWDDATESIPAFLTMVIMPFAFSITEGIAFGFISYALLKLVTGRGREVHGLVYLFAALICCPLYVSLMIRDSRFLISNLESRISNLILEDGNLAEHEKHVGGHCFAIFSGRSKAAGGDNFVEAVQETLRVWMLENILRLALAAAIHIRHHGKVIVVPILGNGLRKIREILIVDRRLDGRLPGLGKLLFDILRKHPQICHDIQGYLLFFCARVNMRIRASQNPASTSSGLMV